MTERYAKLAKMISADTAEKTAKVFNLFSIEQKTTKTKKAFKSFSGAKDQFNKRITHKSRIQENVSSKFFKKEIKNLLFEMF